MGTLKHSAGFTIIEVMLFLAVSGALAAGVLATSTVGINNQRYQDAVNSFKALVQEEFVNTGRVVNPREGVGVCPAPLGGVAAIPGASKECIVMGRLMTISAGGAITRVNIIGKATTATETAASDIDIFRSYAVAIDSLSQQTGEMSWGTAPYRSGGAQDVSIIILRSSLTGNILAFVKYGSIIQNETGLTEFIKDADNSGDFINTTARLICVDPSGWTVAQMQGVVIAPYAASPAAVEQRVAETSECV